MERALHQSLARLCAVFTVALASVACGDARTPSDDHATSVGGAAGASGGGAGATANIGGAASTGDAGSPGLGVDARTMALEMGFGANIGNTLENTARWETGWGQPIITQNFVEGMALHGIKTVRLPVAWDTYAIDGVIQSDKLDRVRQVVKWIVDAGMYAVVNIHWDGGWIRSDGTAYQYQLTDDVRAKFESYWQQIATAFTGVDEHLIFEAMNEEGEFYVSGDKANGPDYAPLNELNQSFVNTVRGTGGWNQVRNLLISGFTTDIERTCVTAFAVPDDPAGPGKLFLSVHYYTPYPFCLMTEPANFWADQWTYPATTWGTTAEKAELGRLFDQLSSFTTQHDVVAIIGEFMAITGSGQYVREPASRVLWMSTVADTARSHGMVPILWDTGGDISRTDGSLSADLTSVMAALTP